MLLCFWLIGEDDATGLLHGSVIIFMEQLFNPLHIQLTCIIGTSKVKFELQVLSMQVEQYFLDVQDLLTKAPLMSCFFTRLLLRNKNTFLCLFASIAFEESPSVLNIDCHYSILHSSVSPFGNITLAVISEGEIRQSMDL